MTKKIIFCNKKNYERKIMRYLSRYKCQVPVLINNVIEHKFPVTLKIIGPKEAKEFASDLTI